MFKYVLPLIALGLLLFAVNFVIGLNKAEPPLPPPVVPAQSPFKSGVAGSGIVEAETENISVGAYVPGIVAEVFVKVGQQVANGQPLFRLDDRQLRAELKYRQTNLKSAEDQLSRLEAMPRPEEIPSTEARVKEAEANLIQQEDLLKRSRSLFGQRVVSEEDMVKQEQATRAARAQAERARADFLLLKAGAWEPDKAVARAAIAQMRAQIEQTETELRRLVVTALVPGEVLQRNVRPGEFVGAPPGQPSIVLGNVNQLHVRADIDENDIPRFRPGTAAKAMLRGDPRQEFPLRFVRVEPFVIPKKSLSGDNSERVDTRVLQVIYALDTKDKRVYVGQQLDVYVEGEPTKP